jgi:hypothetical protein
VLNIIQLLHETLLLAPQPFAMIMFQICRNSGDWFKSEPQERRNKLQLKLERDEKILQTWHNRGG